MYINWEEKNWTNIHRYRDMTYECSSGPVYYNYINTHTRSHSLWARYEGPRHPFRWRSLQTRSHSLTQLFLSINEAIVLVHCQYSLHLSLLWYSLSSHNHTLGWEITTVLLITSLHCSLCELLNWNTVYIPVVTLTVCCEGDSKNKGASLCTLSLIILHSYAPIM